MYWNDYIRELKEVTGRRLTLTWDVLKSLTEAVSVEVMKRLTLTWDVLKSFLRNGCFFNW